MLNLQRVLEAPHLEPSLSYGQGKFEKHSQR